MLFSTKWSLHL